MENEELQQELLTPHEELQKSYQVLTKLVNNMDISNNEWMNELFEELNDPVKKNLLFKIGNNEEPTELVETLLFMQNEADNENQLELESRLFDPAQLQKDLLHTVSLVETAKAKGSKRMDILFAGFQALKQTQKTIITKSINNYIFDSNIHKLDAKITEMEQLVTKLKSSVMEKKFLFNQKKADANLSVEELRHRYEQDIEETIRDLVQSIERSKTEYNRIETRQTQAVVSIEQLKNELSVLLHEIEKEERDRLVKDFNPVQFFYDINSITNNETNVNDAALITQQAVDESFKTLEVVSLENSAILDRIAAAELVASARRTELSQVLKREDNKALERLKKMTVNLESKIDNDHKRVSLLELIVKQIEKDTGRLLDTEPTNVVKRTTAQLRNVVKAVNHLKAVHTNNPQLNNMLNGDEEEETAASAQHRHLYSRYNTATVPMSDESSPAAIQSTVYFSDQVRTIQPKAKSLIGGGVRSKQTADSDLVGVVLCEQEEEDTYVSSEEENREESDTSTSFNTTVVSATNASLHTEESVVLHTSVVPKKKKVRNTAAMRKSYLTNSSTQNSGIVDGSIAMNSGVGAVVVTPMPPPRRAIPTSQINRIQQVVDMFDHERTRVLQAVSFATSGSSGLAEGAIVDTSHILTYSMPVVVGDVDSHLADSVVEQLMETPITSLSRSSLVQHNNRLSSTKPVIRVTTNSQANSSPSHPAKRISVAVTQSTNQDSQPNESEGNGDEVTLEKQGGKKMRQSILRRKQTQLPRRETFSVDNFFKSSVTASNILMQNQPSNGIYGTEIVKRHSMVTSSPPVFADDSSFHTFDANRLIIEGQDSEAAEYYTRTFGYRRAVEQLNTLMNILTNYNSNHVSALDGQVTFSRTAEEELESVEALRHQITGYIHRIKRAYHESHNVQSILKDIQSELNREVRAIDVARNNLLLAIEGVQWPHYLKPGEYQAEAEASKERIRELRQEVRMWESKVNKKRRANVRLSTNITSDRGGGRGVVRGVPTSSTEGLDHKVNQDDRTGGGGHVQTEDNQTSHQMSAARDKARDRQNQVGRDNVVVAASDNIKSSHLEKKGPVLAAPTADRIKIKSADIDTAVTDPSIQRPSKSQHSNPRVRIHQKGAAAASSRHHHGGMHGSEEHFETIHHSLEDNDQQQQQQQQGASSSNNNKYSVSNNRLAIFNDITEIYDNTLRAFRMASSYSENASKKEDIVSVESVSEQQLPPYIDKVGDLIGDNTDSISPIIINSVVLKDSSIVGANNEYVNQNEEEDDDEKEELDVNSVGPVVVHFVPAELRGNIDV